MKARYKAMEWASQRYNRGEQIDEWGVARGAYLAGCDETEKELLEELRTLSLSSNPMDYVEWVSNMIKNLSEYK